MLEIVVKTADGGVAVPYFIEVTKPCDNTVKGEVYWVDCAYPLMPGVKYKGYLLIDYSTGDATFICRGLA